MNNNNNTYKDKEIDDKNNNNDIKDLPISAVKTKKRKLSNNNKSSDKHIESFDLNNKKGKHNDTEINNESYIINFNDDFQTRDERNYGDINESADEDNDNKTEIINNNNNDDDIINDDIKSNNNIKDNNNEIANDIKEYNLKIKNYKLDIVEIKANIALYEAKITKLENKLLDNKKTSDASAKLSQPLETPKLTKEILNSIINSTVSKFKAESKRRESLEGHNRPLADVQTTALDHRAKFGSLLKFVNRDNEVMTMLYDLAKKYEDFKANSTISKVLLCLPGSPGIGKSTFIKRSLVSAIDKADIWGSPLNESFKEVIRDSVESGSIFRYSLEEGLTDYQLRNPVITMSTELLYLYMKNINDGLSQVHYSLLFDEFKKYDPSSVFAEVLSYFQNHLGRKYPGVVVINIDETNMIDTDNEKYNFLSKIIQQSFIYLQRKMNDDTSYPFLYLTFSGTNTKNLPDYLNTCSHTPPIKISLPLLKFEDCLDVVNDTYVRTFEESNRENRAITTFTTQIQYLVNMTNGIPRYLEALIFALGCEDKRGFTMCIFQENVTKSDLDHKMYFKLTTTFIKHSYQRAYMKIMEIYKKELLLRLVCHNLFDTPVNALDEYFNVNLSSLVDIGLLFLESISDTDLKLIRIPFILLRIVLTDASNLKTLCPMILYKDEPLSSTENELDDLKIFHLRYLNAKYIKNGETVYIEDIFDFLDSHIKFKEDYKQETVALTGKIKKSTKQLFTSEILKSYVNNPEYDGLLVLNYPQTNAPDSFVFCNLKFVSAIQSKINLSGKDGDSSITLKTISLEHLKFSTKKKHLFIIITDQNFEDFQNLKDNEIVIGKSLLVKWMGRQMSFMRSKDFYFKPVLEYTETGKKRRNNEISCNNSSNKDSR